MSKPIAILKGVVRREIESPDGTTQVYFLGTMESSQAKELTFVPVIADEATARRRRTFLNETNNGYQRPGASRRMESFADYLAEFPLRYTPAVVLSGRGKWEYSETDSSLKVHAPAAIIDGQHRVGGFVCQYERSDFPRNVDFVLLNLDSITEEEKTFVAINSNAKSVATGIVAVIGRGSDVQVAELLNTHQASLLRKRFYIAQSNPGALFNISSVAKEIGTTFSHGVFEAIANDVDLKFDFMLAYWEEIATYFPEEWSDIDLPRAQRKFKLLELTGFIAWSKAASEILAPAYDADSKTIDWTEVKESIGVLAVAGALDWNKKGEYQNATGNVGAQQIHRKMQLVLAQHRQNH